MAEGNGSVVDKMRYTSIPAKKLLRKRLKETSARPCSFWARAIGITVLVILLALSAATCFIMWGTDSYDSAFLENLVLRNNTKMFEWWQEPPVIPYIKVRLFNYTNYQKVMDGSEKPKLEEVGPFTFMQKMEKTSVKFSDDGTVTYNERTVFTLAPELSIRLDHDKVFLPNVPFLSAVSVLKNSDPLKQITMGLALNAVKPPPFLHFSAEEFLWGYKETLTQLAKAFSIVDIDPESLKLGILEARAGIMRDAVTVETGARDIDRLGLIVDVGGRKELDAWGNTSCSRIDGSDGSMFPPRLVQRRQRLHIFTKDMCRKLPMDFNHTTMVSGIEALVYTPPLNVFGTPDQNPDNACFCPTSPNSDEVSCPQGGVFNVGPCNFGAPVLVSFPHFYGGDSELLNFVDGLQPEESKHAMYLYVHPTLGVPMGGRTRFQMNVRIHKSSRISSIDFFEEGSVLPVAWIEIGVDELPGEVTSLLSQASLAEYLKVGLLYGSIIVIILTALLLLLCAYRCWMRRETIHNLSQDNYVLEPL